MTAPDRPVQPDAVAQQEPGLYPCCERHDESPCPQASDGGHTLPCDLCAREKWLLPMLAEAEERGWQRGYQEGWNAADRSRDPGCRG